MLESNFNRYWCFTSWARATLISMGGWSLNLGHIACDFNQYRRFRSQPCSSNLEFAGYGLNILPPNHAGSRILYSLSFVSTCVRPWRWSFLPKDTATNAGLGITLKKSSLGQSKFSLQFLSSWYWPTLKRKIRLCQSRPWGYCSVKRIAAR